MSTFDMILCGVIVVCVIGIIALIVLIVKANKKIKQLNGTAKVKTKASKQQVPNYQQPQQQPMAGPMMNQAGMQQPANNMQPQMVNPTMNQVGIQQPAQPQIVKPDGTIASPGQAQPVVQGPVKPQIVKPDGTITSPGQPQMGMTQQHDVVNNQPDQGVNPTPVQ